MSEIKITDDTTTIPEGVKKPQDRKPRVNKDGTKTVTVHGQEYTIAADALDDFELLDDLDSLDEGEVQRLPRILRRLLGKESFKRRSNRLGTPRRGGSPWKLAVNWSRTSSRNWPQTPNARRSPSGVRRAVAGRLLAILRLRLTRTGRVPGFHLWEVADFAEHLPDDSATKRALGQGWTLLEQLTALIADRLAVLAWQKTADGRRANAHPSPFRAQGSRTRPPRRSRANP
ncbi:DUF5361 domain-containing protein [Arthrobacter woluwensis]|nr:DUF5361 domain-containing protein [Arthrobacter woluwensis]